MGIETGRGMMRMFRDGSRTGFLSVFAPSVSLSLLEIFGFQDVIKIENKTTIFS